MKKELKNKLIFISGVVFALALLFVSVQIIQAGWTAPTAPFPGGTVYPPIDSGPGFQTKEGGIIFGSSTTPIQGAIVKVQENQSFAASNSSDAGSFTPSFSSFGAIINSQKNLLINTRGLVLPRAGTGAPSDSPLEGSIYYDTTKKGVKLWTGGPDWVDIGSGSGTSTLKIPVILTGGSGSIGMILNKDSNDTSGTNSPMLMFSGNGVNPKNPTPPPQIDFYDMFKVQKAHALKPAWCDPTLETGCDAGGTYGGSGGLPITPLSSPTWWMRQEGDFFAINVSNYSEASGITDVRPAIIINKSANLIFPGELYMQRAGQYVRAVPDGTMCGLQIDNKIISGCASQPPRDRCPAGWDSREWGAGSKMWSCFKANQMMGN